MLIEDEAGTLFTIHYNRLVFGSKEEKSVKRGQLIKYLDEKKLVKKGIFIQKVRGKIIKLPGNFKIPYSNLFLCCR